VGKQGAILKAIIAQTGTTIQVGKYEKSDDNSEEDEIVVTINGSVGAIEDAKQEIDRIVAERVNNANSRVLIIEVELMLTEFIIVCLLGQIALNYLGWKWNSKSKFMFRHSRLIKKKKI
jgi:hypothetical protein